MFPSYNHCNKNARIRGIVLNIFHGLFTHLICTIINFIDEKLRLKEILKIFPQSTQPMGNKAGFPTWVYWTQRLVLDLNLKEGQNI